LRVVRTLHRRRDVEYRDARVREPLDEILESLRGSRTLRRTEEREEHRPVARRRAVLEAHDAEPGVTATAEDVGEARVVVEVELHARGVQEQELPRELELALAVPGDQFARERRELLERLLHDGVLDRIHLEIPQR